MCVPFMPVPEETKPVILVVDDTKEIRDILTKLLSGRFEVMTAGDGEVALQMLKEGIKKPDLILLDMSMPGKDGLFVCEKLKSHETTKAIPVIFLTGNTDEGMISNGFAVGAVDYVRKPFHIKELMARIETHVRLKRSIETLSNLSQQLGKYLSPGLYESIFSGHTHVRIESQRKILTVCFTDIVGFTPISEKLSNRELTDWLNTYLNKMVAIAIRHGGALDKFIGDGIMFFFGDLNHEDPKTGALNCVKMVQEMIVAANEMNINIRGGINTGPCRVGNFGSENHMEYGVIGREVNLAARLESNSEPNRILISEATYDLINDQIPCEARGKIRVKGIDEPVSAYWVSAETPLRTASPN